MKNLADIAPLVIIPGNHDGNLKKLYSWIHKFEHKWAGLACVHPSAYKSADFMEVPRKMILNPQNLDPLPEATPFKKRQKILLAPQTFKRWKRVDDLIAAVPYIEGNVIVAGDGMERAYMMSEEKCKDEYYCTKQLDPNATEDRLGKRIWQNAEESGNFKYVGFVSEAKRDEILGHSMFLLDPSWSLTYGEHFNRSIVDAMRVGVVPIARNLGISDNQEGIGSLFKPNENYLMIPHDATPKQFGDLVNKFFNISEADYMRIVENNYKLIKENFDRKVIAQQYIDLATKKEGDVGDHQIDGGKAVAKGNKIWDDHFEVPATLEDFFV